MTDVTGFGLLGHLVEICKGSKVGALLDYAALPILPNALSYANRGCITGASARNWFGRVHRKRLRSRRKSVTPDLIQGDALSPG